MRCYRAGFKIMVNMGVKMVRDQSDLAASCRPGLKRECEYRPAACDRGFVQLIFRRRIMPQRATCAGSGSAQSRPPTDPAFAGPSGQARDDAGDWKRIAQPAVAVHALRRVRNTYDHDDI